MSGFKKKNHYGRIGVQSEPIQTAETKVKMTDPGRYLAYLRNTKVER